MKQIVIYKNQSKLRNFILMLRGSEANGFMYVLYCEENWVEDPNYPIYNYYDVGDEARLPFPKIYFTWELGLAVSYIDDSVKNDNDEEEAQKYCDYLNEEERKEVNNEKSTE